MVCDKNTRNEMICSLEIWSILALMYIAELPSLPSSFPFRDPFTYIVVCLFDTWSDLCGLIINTVYFRVCDTYL